MTTPTTTGRALAIAAGVLASAGALGILWQEPMRSGQWHTEHWLMPLIVATTIMTGHLVGDALRARAWLNAAGFGLAFVLGTGGTLYTSIGAQEATSGAAAATAEAHNTALAAKRAAIAAARHEQALATDMLHAAERQLDAQCVRGRASRAQCDGIRATVSTYRGSQKGHGVTVAELEAELAAMGGERIARPRARALAETLAAMGADAARVEIMAARLEAPAYSTLLELTAIVAFGFGFRRRAFSGALRVPTEHPRAGHAAPPEPDTPVDAPKPTPTPSISEQPPRLRLVSSKPSATRRLPSGQPKAQAKEHAMADLLAILARGEAIPAQQVLADRWTVRKQRVSDWLGEWDAAGQIPARQQDGRRKRLAAL